MKQSKRTGEMGQMRRENTGRSIAERAAGEPGTVGKRVVIAAAAVAFLIGMGTAVFGLPLSLMDLAETGDCRDAGCRDGDGLTETELAETGMMETGLTEAELAETAAMAPSISASGAILINGDDGMVLYENNADEKLYPASTTKIMTALVTLDVCKELHVDLNSEVVVPEEAQGVEGSSLYLKSGERVTLEELLYGLMLQSGNDSAVALAVCMGGTQDHFIEMMNEKAQKLGCTGTHFTNPNGLFDENHYTTARDLAVIAREAMKNEDFREIVSAKKWSEVSADASEAAATVAPAGAAEDASSGAAEDAEEDASAGAPRSFVNKNKTVFQYEGGNGIKIGYTQASGRTLVASAKRGGTQLIAVVLRDHNWFQDAYNLMDFGFELLEVEGGTN